MIVQFIVQHKLPLIIYPDFIALQKSLHAFVSNDVGVYTSNKTARDMVHCLATACKVQQIENIRDAPCVGITIDESQDRAVRSQMIIFCKFVHRGAVEEVELGVEELPNGKASTVFAALQNCLKKISGDLIAQWNQKNPGAYRACCEKLAQMQSAAGKRKKNSIAGHGDNDLGLDVRQPEQAVTTTRSGRTSVASNAHNRDN